MARKAADKAAQKRWDASHASQVTYTVTGCPVLND